MTNKLKANKPLRIVRTTYMDPKNIFKNKSKARFKSVNQETVGNAKTLIKGYITVAYGIDAVILNHKVNGRVSEMYLSDYDTIEIKDEDKNVWLPITCEKLLDRNLDSLNINKTKSDYYDPHARVMLASRGNKEINLLQKRWKIHEVVHYLKSGVINEDEATASLTRIEMESDK